MKPPPGTQFGVCFSLPEPLSATLVPLSMLVPGPVPMELWAPRTGSTADKLSCPGNCPAWNLAQWGTGKYWRRKGGGEIHQQDANRVKGQGLCPRKLPMAPLRGRKCSGVPRMCAGLTTILQAQGLRGNRLQASFCSVRQGWHLGGGHVYSETPVCIIPLTSLLTKHPQGLDHPDLRDRTPEF